MEGIGLRKVLCCIGTRPEAIKMAPVVAALRGAAGIDCRVVSTGQHRDLLDTMLRFFDLTVDLDLRVMESDQSLAGLTARLLTELDAALEKESPDLVLAQGDTTSIFVTALACFYRGIPFGHVEAGLRTHDLGLPFPEEANRVLAGRLARLHFAPTPKARENLESEGVARDAVHVVGNTGVDALLATRQRVLSADVDLDPTRRLILVTAHRRESFGEPIVRICRAIARIAQQFPDTEFLWPVHPNPNVRGVVHAALGDHPRVRLTEPLSYGPFVQAMNAATLILTDSGGVQEEAPALGKPVLVLRDESERPEAISAGVSLLVGSDDDRIFRAARLLLDDEAAYARMSVGASPYGDGRASARITRIIQAFLSVDCEGEPLEEFRPALSQA